MTPQVTDTVDEKAPAFVGRRDHHAGNRRPEQARDVDHRRVQRDRVAEIGLVLDQRDEECLPARHVERVDDALQHTEPDNRSDGDVAGQRQPGQSERLQHRHDLRGDQQPATVPAIDEDAGERTEHERGKLSGEADDAEQPRRAGQTVDQPAGGGGRDPGSSERDNLTAEEQPVVAVAQRSQHERDAAGPPLRHTCHPPPSAR